MTNLRSIVLFVSAVACAMAQDSGRIDFLLDRLEKGSDFKVRIAAATQLGKVADGSVVHWMLQSFRREKNAAVRLATLEAVEKIPDAVGLPAVVDLYTTHPLSSAEIVHVERILWTSRRAISPSSWVSMLDSAKDPFQRGLSAWILGLSGDPSGLKAVMRASDSDDAGVRRQAYRALGLTGGAAERAFCEQRRSGRDQVLAQDCVRWIDARAKKSVPPQQNPFVETHAGALPKGIFTPQAFSRYQALVRAPAQTPKPEAWIAAADNLRESAPQERSAGTVPLMESQEVLPTLRMSADVMGDYEFYAQDLAVLQSALKDRAAAIDACYMRRLEQKAKIRGDLVIQTRIDGAGKVLGVDFLKGSLSDAELRTCVSQIVRTTKFPKTRFKSVDVKYSFSFFPPKDMRFQF